MAQRICGNCFLEMEPFSNQCPHCGHDPVSWAQQYPLALPERSILNGRYILGRVLGQGGFGITYIAQDVQTKEQIAIKEFFPENLATRTDGHNVTPFSEQRQENYQYGMTCFLTEAQTMAQFIGVEGIVRVHSYFEENNTAYFVMEYVEGVSLKDYLQQHGGKIPWETTREILLPVMEALSVVHNRGIIHRDIAPDNICITRDGRVKLLDFGAARYSLGDRSRSLDVVLKAGYAPKEQYTRRGKQGPFTDVYALAATFYRCITGRVPPESIDRLEEDDLVLPNAYGIKIPEALEDVLEKALSVHPADRFQSMAEFHGALETAVPEAALPEPPVMEAPPVVEEPPVIEEPPAVEESEETAPNSLPENANLQPDPVTEDASKPKLPRKKATVIAAAALTVSLAAGAATMWIIPATQYDKASTLLESGNYDDAYELFSKLNNYEDSKTLASEALYRKATAALENSAYDEAQEIFLTLGSYSDSKTRVSECQYQKAKNLLAEKQYEEAQVIFQKLGSYSDSQTMVTECQYCNAKDLLEQKQYDHARALFQKLGDYSDSKTMATECSYQEALELLNQKKYDEAYKLFVKLGDYHMSEDKAKECHYEQGKELLSDKKYDDAYEIFEELGDYQDSQKLASEALYHITHLPNGGALVSDSRYTLLREADSTVYGCCHLPQLNVTGAQTFNKAMDRELTAFMEENQELLFALHYTWNTKGNVVSILAQIELDWDMTAFYGYYADRTTGAALTKADLLAVCGMTKETFTAACKKALTAYLNAEFGESSQLKDLKAWTLTSENLAACIPFLNEAGDLCFAADIASLAGADSYWHMLDMSGNELPFRTCTESHR